MLNPAVTGRAYYEMGGHHEVAPALSCSEQPLDELEPEWVWSTTDKNIFTLPMHSHLGPKRLVVSFVAELYLLDSYPAPDEVDMSVAESDEVVGVVS